MDDSTPISSLHGDDRNSGDDNKFVNKLMDKYVALEKNEQMDMANMLMPRPQPGGEMSELPPLDRNQRDMEEKFENRDLNKDLFQLNAQDPILMRQFEQELQNSRNYIKGQNMMEAPEMNEDDYDEYEEMEYEEPLWRKILNEVRIPIVIVIYIFLFFHINIGFDKLLCRYPFFGNQHNQCYWTGTLLKAVFVGIFSYITLRYIKI